MRERKIKVYLTIIHRSTYKEYAIVSHKGNQLVSFVRGGERERKIKAYLTIIHRSTYRECAIVSHKGNQLVSFVSGWCV